FLEQASNQGASMTQAACALGVSERSLRRELERTGTSYRRLVRDARERRARRELRTTDKTIQEIAFELGFDTASNFARSFKQWTGVTPSAFRQRQANRAPAGQN
ncbi:MAG: helix-turn-helix transcriptional regulator, partial [Pseudomonadota bacterium]